MQEIIVNKVAESGIITLNLEDYYPKEDIVVFDLKEYLFMGLILKEKDFRAALQEIDWQQYQNKYVAVYCSADAIIPIWAYMLVAVNLQPIAKDVIFGDGQTLIKEAILKKLNNINSEDFRDKRVVVKGCGDVEIPVAAYVEITNKLRPYAKSIMFGEPCSTVPLYKRK
jgi:hypothetical protein